MPTYRNNISRNCIVQGEQKDARLNSHDDENPLALVSLRLSLSLSTTSCFGNKRSLINLPLLCFAVSQEFLLALVNFVAPLWLSHLQRGLEALFPTS